MSSSIWKGIAKFDRSCFIRGNGAMAGKGFPEDFSIAVCQEGEPWRVVIEEKGCLSRSDSQPHDISTERAGTDIVKVAATRLRLVADKYRFQLAAVEVFGRPVEAKPLTAKSVDASQAATTILQGLRCEHYADPVGVDAAQPRLDWIMNSSVRGQRQTAYRVLAASTRESLNVEKADVWDSGKVAGDQSVAVRCAGTSLKSGQRYFWKVMAWDKEGKPTPWSARTGDVCDRQTQGGRLARPVDRRQRLLQLRHPGILCYGQQGR